MGSGSKAASELTDNYPEVYTRNEPFSELRTSSKKSLPIFWHQYILINFLTLIQSKMLTSGMCYMLQRKAAF
jgi:hypothetical protein